MIQPNKDKKKAMGTPVAGTTKEIELTPREVKVRQIVKRDASTKEGLDRYDKTYGSEKKEGSDEFTPREDKRKIVPGDRTKGVKTRMFDEQGKEIQSELQGSSQEKEMIRKYKVRKSDIESRRQRNTDKLNFDYKDEKTRASGEQNKAYQERLRQEEAKNK